MNIIRIVFVGLLSLQFSVGQEQVLAFNLESDLKRSNKTTYALTNKLTNDFVIAIKEKKTMYAKLFDASYNLKSSVSFKAPKRKYDDPLGYSVNGNVYTMVYATTKKWKFIAIVIDFDAKTSKDIELDFSLKDELYIETVNHNNKLFTISAIEEKVSIHELNPNLEFQLVKEIPIDKTVKKSWAYEGYNSIFDFFTTTLNDRKFEKIDHRVPASIEQASKPNKVYRFDDRLVLTLEDEDNGTYIYELDLNSFEFETHRISYPSGKIDNYKKHNTFLYEDLVFQLSSSRKEMDFSILNYNGELLKTFYYGKDDPISIMNGKIIQDGQTAIPFKTKREFEETSKYLRKVSAGDIGMSIIKNNGLYEITLGGVKEIQAGGSGFMMGPGFGSMPIGNTGLVMTFNPTFYSYESYTNTKATFFDTVLTENFEHVKKEFEPTVFDRIDDYMVDYDKVTGEDLFYLNGVPHYTYVDMATQTCYLVKF